MLLDIEKSGEKDKERSKEWLMITNPGKKNVLFADCIILTNGAQGFCRSSRRQHVKLV